MKNLLLIVLFFIMQPVSNEQIYKNTGFYNNTVLYEPIVSTTSYGRIRKVVGYTNDGDSIDTGTSTRGNPNPMWLDEYGYYYYNGYWYRNNGSSWQLWNSLFGLGLFGWNWYNSSMPDNPVLYYLERSDPIGAPICLLPFGLLYLLKKRKENGKEISLN